MKALKTFPVLILVAVQPAFAETCHERFVRLLKSAEDTNVPTKKVVITEMKNGPKMTNENYWLAVDHTMSVMIDPPGPSVLVYKDTMYTSADAGKTWTVLRKIDSAEGESHLQKLADTVTNATCGEDELDGVTFDTVEADYVMGSDPNLTEIHNKYWVSRTDEFIPKSETAMKMKSNGFENFVTQHIEKAPDLKLPTPK